MKVTQSKQGMWTVLALTGKVDHAGADELEAMLLPLMSGGSVALDFRGVDYITSSGFRVLMHAEREQHAKKGRLVLGNMTSAVRYIFDTAGLSQHFKIVHELSAVLNAPGPGGGRR